MATTPHSVIKPEKLVATAVGVLESEVLLPGLIAREGVDQYKGADDDTVNFKVEGVLPHREYGWRNDRTDEIVFDTYAERKIAVSFGGNVYSAVKCLDEQADFDLDKWGKLITPQAKAVARGLDHRVRKAMTSAAYNVTIGNAGRAVRSAAIEARRVLNAFHAPAGNRVLLVGTEFESAILNDDKLNLASAVGDAIASERLREAVLGRLAGFTVVVDQDLKGDEAYAFADSAFFLATGAPSVPSSVPEGSTISYGGYALRWVKDYDTTRMQDRSVVNTYAGVRTVEDPLAYWDPTANGGRGMDVVTSDEYLVRGIKLLLDGSSDYPAANSELAKATGISDAKVWTPTGFGAETDVTDPGPNNA